MLKIKTDSNKQIDIENKSIEISDRVSTDGAVTIAAKAPTEIKIIKATAVKSVVSDDGEVELKDASSVRKVTSIIGGVIAKNIIENAKNNTPTETSDEFTYTKTPGSIPKIFFHIGHIEKCFERHGTYDNADEILDEDDRWIYDHLVPRMRINGSSGELEEDGSCCVIMDADGVRRYEFGLCYGFTTKQCLNGFYGYIQVAHPDKTIVIDANIDLHSTPTDIANAIIESDAVAEEITSSKYKKKGNCSIATRIRNSYPVVVSSDLLFGDSYGVDRLLYDDDINSSTYEELLNNDGDHQDSSGICKGIYIIEKAVQEGRALDIFVDANSGSDYIHYANDDAEG